MKEFMDQEQARRDCYKLLAACFYPPQKELFREESLFSTLAELLKRVCPDAVPCAENMEKAFLEYNAEELLVDYATLFVGPNELMAPPYGSIYLDEGRHIMGSSTMKVLELYKEEGLSLDPQFSDLPDHIAAELEFMYYCAYQEVDALEKKNSQKAASFLQKQEFFQKTFLSPWVFLLCEKIVRGTSSEFYSSLADCLSVFMANAKMPEALPAGGC